MVKKISLALLCVVIVIILFIANCVKIDDNELITVDTKETELATIVMATEEQSEIVTTTAPVVQDLEDLTTEVISPKHTTTIVETTREYSPPPPSSTKIVESSYYLTEATNDILYLTREYEVPNVKDFKSWTNFRKSVNRNSGQWKILTGEGTWTDNNGFRRKNDDYMVAMGSYYTHTLGDRFRISTEDGNVFTVTICDWKNDKHTDSKHQYSVGTGCIVEFYVDDNLASSVRQSGTASSIPELSGKITKIEYLF